MANSAEGAPHPEDALKDAVLPPTPPSLRPSVNLSGLLPVTPGPPHPGTVKAFPWDWSVKSPKRGPLNKVLNLLRCVKRKSGQACSRGGSTFQPKLPAHLCHT